MKLLLIRHPKPDIPEGLCYGRLDVPPETADLERLVARLRARWASGAHPRPLAVFSSPLQRCARVAQALGGDLWPQARMDDRLMEMNFGHWEGQLWGTLPPEQIEAWRADITGHVPPGGESVADMSERARAFADEHLPGHDTPADAEVVLVTHAGIIQTLPRALMGVPMSEFRMSKLDYGTITTVTRLEGRFELHSHNVAP